VSQCGAHLGAALTPRNPRNAVSPAVAVSVFENTAHRNSIKTETMLLGYCRRGTTCQEIIAKCQLSGASTG
jgi:hypothetical protein